MMVMVRVLGRKPHERVALCAGNGGPHDHLVPILEHLLDRHLQIRKPRAEFDEQVFGTFSPRGLARGRRNVHSVLAQDAVDEPWIFPVECLNELRGRNITVNAVVPGPVGTEVFLTGKTEVQIDQMSKLPPLECLGQPEDIANMVSFRKVLRVARSTPKSSLRMAASRDRGQLPTAPPAHCANRSHRGDQHAAHSHMSGPGSRTSGSVAPGGPICKKPVH
jgi:hypothetical protein